MEKSESIKELATALCKFQGAVEKIKKGSENPFYHSKYADLTSILDVIRKPLSENGLSFVQFPTGQNGLETTLMHTSGEWMSAIYEMKPIKSDPQGLGSAITYQRRYAIGSILGLSTEDDDDGNNASKPASGQSVKKDIQKPLPADLDAKLVECITLIENTTTTEELVNIYNSNPLLQTNEIFSKALGDQKRKIKKTNVNPE